MGLFRWALTVVWRFRRVLFLPRLSAPWQCVIWLRFMALGKCSRMARAGCGLLVSVYHPNTEASVFNQHCDF